MLDAADVTAMDLPSNTQVATTTANTAGKYGITGFNPNSNYMLRATKVVGAQTFDLRAFARTNGTLSQQTAHLNAETTVAATALQTRLDQWAAATSLSTPANFQSLYAPYLAAAAGVTPNLFDPAAITAAANSVLNGTLPNGSYIGTYSGGSSTGKVGIRVAGSDITIVIADDQAGSGIGWGNPNDWRSPFSIDVLSDGGIANTIVGAGGIDFSGIMGSSNGAGVWTDSTVNGIWNVSLRSWNYAGLYFGVANADDNAAGGYCAVLVQNDGTAVFLMNESLSGYRVQGTGIVSALGGATFGLKDNFGSTESVTVNFAGGQAVGSFIGSNGDNYSFTLNR